MYDALMRRDVDGLSFILALSAGFTLGRAPESGWKGWVAAVILLALFLHRFLRATRY